MAGSIDFTARVSIFNKTKPVWSGRLNISNTGGKIYVR